MDPELIDPFRLSVALGPLGLYCLLLGARNLARRPWLTTGARDQAFLAVAVSGMMVVGPLDLFLPEPAAISFGSYVWLFMLAFYGLVVSFAVLLSRPRLVIYNMTLDELRPILAELVPSLDQDARWAGDSLTLPGLGVQLYVDSFPAMRNVSLVSAGPRQNFGGWRHLETSLAAALGEAQTQFNPRGVSLIVCGLLVLALCLVQGFGDPQSLAQGMRDMLRL